VKRLNLSLTIVLSFGSVLLAALAILAAVVVAANRDLGQESGLRPGLWGLGYAAGAMGQGIGQAEGSRLAAGAPEGLRPASEAVLELAGSRGRLDQANADLEARTLEFRRIILELALKPRPEAGPAWAALLFSALKATEQNPPDLDALSGLKAIDGAERMAALAASLAEAAQARSLALAELSGASAALSNVSAVLAVGHGGHGRRVLVGLLALLALSAGLVWLLDRAVIKPLKRIQVWLDQSAGDVTKTALSLSRSSRSLAKGASENTKAVLDAISSLEVLFSTAKRNAGHAGQAKELMDRAKSFVDEAHASMRQISAAMEEIKASGQASRQIVKTVDEIAFQTNILALNAAVEAARAGEAGLGFAVVADEVRNLANSSSAAARSTTSMLDSSLRLINEGASLVTKAEDSFESLVATSDEVAGLMTGITEASQSQAREIQDVHQSIALVDKVTQENSLEAADAGRISSELNRQADLLNQTISQVALVVSGQPIAQSQRPAREARATSKGVSFMDQVREEQVKEEQPKKAFAKPSKTDLDQALPMDDDFF
jgi:methyl-accepting chemotaxis protein